MACRKKINIIAIDWSGHYIVRSRALFEQFWLNRRYSCT
jgi:hypothetical protein